MADFNVDKVNFKRDMDNIGWTINERKKELRNVENSKSKLEIIMDELEKGLEEINYAKSDLNNGGFISSGKYYQQPVIEKMINELCDSHSKTKKMYKSFIVEKDRLEKEIEYLNVKYTEAKYNYYKS